MSIGELWVPCRQAGWKQPPGLSHACPRPQLPQRSRRRQKILQHWSWPRVFRQLPARRLHCHQHPTGALSGTVGSRCARISEARIGPRSCTSGGFSVTLVTTSTSSTRSRRAEGRTRIFRKRSLPGETSTTLPTGRPFGEDAITTAGDELFAGHDALVGHDVLAL